MPPLILEQPILFISAGFYFGLGLTFAYALVIGMVETAKWIAGKFKSKK